jgi:cell division protein FtsW (lipid II flippase)
MLISVFFWIGPTVPTDGLLRPISFNPQNWLSRQSFSRLFSRKPHQVMDDWRNTLLPAMIPTCLFLALIVFQPDLGTAIACAGITACILFVAGIQLRYFAYAFLGSLAALLPTFSRCLSA